MSDDASVGNTQRFSKLKKEEDGNGKKNTHTKNIQKRKPVGAESSRNFTRTATAKGLAKGKTAISRCIRVSRANWIFIKKLNKRKFFPGPSLLV
jgi:hypothetical protein